MGEDKDTQSVETEEEKRAEIRKIINKIFEKATWEAGGHLMPFKSVGGIVGLCLLEGERFIKDERDQYLFCEELEVVISESRGNWLKYCSEQFRLKPNELNQQRDETERVMKMLIELTRNFVHYKQDTKE